MFVNRYVHSLLNHNRRLPLTIWLSSLIDARKERKISDKVYAIRSGFGSRVRQRAHACSFWIGQARGYAMIADLCRIVLLNSSVIYKRVASSRDNAPGPDWSWFLFTWTGHSRILLAQQSSLLGPSAPRAEILPHRGESQSRRQISRVAAITWKDIYVSTCLYTGC